MKYTLRAVIPTGRYANLQPEITVEADTFEEAQAQAMPYIEQVWAQYGEKPLVKIQTYQPGTTQIPGGQVIAPTQTKRLKDFFGNEIDYDETNHVYSWKGEVYQSGSQYAAQFEKPFDKKTIAEKMASKYKVNAQDIIDMWGLNGRTSMEFGTAIHSALELYGKHRELAIALERDSALHSHPIIKHAVESFYKGREDEQAYYEVLIIDHKNKHAGRVDRLLHTGKGIYTVQDYKTGAEMKPDKLKVYWKQLEFYSLIIESNNRKTNSPQIFHYNGEWKEYTHD